MNLANLEVMTPGFSVQDLSHTNILSMPLGKVVPVLVEWFHPNESIEVDFDWLCRTFPMNAPLMDNMEISFDAFWVPARVLGISGAESVGFNFEEFYNPRNLQSNTQLPQVDAYNLVKKVLAKYGKLSGTLYDYLQFPTFPIFFEKLWESVSNLSFVILDEEENGSTYRFSEFDPNWLATSAFVAQSVDWNYTSEASEIWLDAISTIGLIDDNLFSNNVSYPYIPYCSFTAWVLRQFAIFIHPQVENPFAAGTLRNLVVAAKAYVTNADGSLVDDPLGVICNKMNVYPSQLVDMWRAWLLSDRPDKERNAGRITIGSFLDNFVVDISESTAGILAAIPGIDDTVWPATRLLLYQKIINDWYVNPLLVDGDDRYKSIASALIEDDALTTLIDLSERLYGFDDAFVTCTAAADQPNVLLPNNPSVKDIRNANRLQIMLERIAKTGRRYMDQILTTFGIQPDNKRLDRSEVLFRRTQYLDMQSVTQTNQADFSKVLNTPIGSQFGQSVSFQSFSGNTITFDEHGYYVIMASIRPKASYFQGLLKEFTLLKADQFLVPDFAQIGDDQVMSKEIYYDFGKSADSTVFGYNQRYYNWMWHPSEVHGLMQNEMDYYHLARKFDQSPVLNTKFTSVNVDQNDLNRIFTVYDDSPFLMWLNFREMALRPIPTSSMYSL